MYFHSGDIQQYKHINQFTSDPFPSSKVSHILTLKILQDVYLMQNSTVAFPKSFLAFCFSISQDIHKPMIRTPALQTRMNPQIHNKHSGLQGHYSESSAQTIPYKKKSFIPTHIKNFRTAVMTKSYKVHVLPDIFYDKIPLTLFHLLSIRHVQYCIYHENMLRLKCISFIFIPSSTKI